MSDSFPQERIVPFPLARRRDFVRRHAARMAALPQATAEKHLRAQLDLQRKTMTRRGIAGAVIDAELRALELAIRAELWRAVMTPGGAA